jgi:hypothetical protein
VTDLAESIVIIITAGEAGTGVTQPRMGIISANQPATCSANVVNCSGARYDDDGQRWFLIIKPEPADGCIGPGFIQTALTGIRLKRESGPGARRSATGRQAISLVLIGPGASNADAQRSVASACGCS